MENKTRIVTLSNDLPVTVRDITNEESYKNPRITYLDYGEEQCWELFKDYASMVGAEISEEDEDEYGPDYDIAKEISEKIIDIVEEVFGVPFPVSKGG